MPLFFMENMMNWTPEIKNNFRSLLTNGNVTVTFTKQNGETRVMNATLRPDVLAEWTYSDKPRRENPDVCNVWDLDKKEWRSFRFENITKFETVLS